MYKSFINFINYTFRFGKDDRLIFYEIISNQLSSGLSEMQIFENLIDLRISPEVTKISEVICQALSEGRELSSGLADSNFLPPYELGLFSIADGNREVLPQILIELRQRVSENVSFMGNVIVPNAYYLVIFGAVLALGSSLEGFGEVFGSFSDIDKNPGYVLSVQINTYGPIVFFSLIGLCILIWYIKTHCYGGIRRLIPFFNHDSKMQYGSRFCNLAATMSKLGAANIHVLESALKVFGASGFMRKSLEVVQDLHIDGGEDYFDCLGRTFLDPKMARTLKAMSGDGSRDGTMSLAFESVSNLQNILCRKTYAKLKVFFQFLLLVATAYVMLTVVIGIYSIYSI